MAVQVTMYLQKQESDKWHGTPLHLAIFKYSACVVHGVGGSLGRQSVTSSHLGSMSAVNYRL